MIKIKIKIQIKKVKFAGRLSTIFEQRIAGGGPRRFWRITRTILSWDRTLDSLGKGQGPLVWVGRLCEID